MPHPLFLALVQIFRNFQKIVFITTHNVARFNLVSLIRYVIHRAYFKIKTGLLLMVMAFSGLQGKTVCYSFSYKNFLALWLLKWRKIQSLLLYVLSLILFIFSQLVCIQSHLIYIQSNYIYSV